MSPLKSRKGLPSAGGGTSMRVLSGSLICTTSHHHTYDRKTALAVHVAVRPFTFCKSQSSASCRLARRWRPLPTTALSAPCSKLIQSLPEPRGTCISFRYGCNKSAHRARNMGALSHMRPISLTHTRTLQALTCSALIALRYRRRYPA